MIERSHIEEGRGSLKGEELHRRFVAAAEAGGGWVSHTACNPDPTPDPSPDSSPEPSQVRHKDTNVVRYVAGALQNLVARLRVTSTHWKQLSYLTELSRSAPRTRGAAAWMDRLDA